MALVLEATLYRESIERITTQQRHHDRKEHQDNFKTKSHRDVPSPVRIIDELVTKGVLNFGFIAIQVSEEVIAHGNGAVVV